eukprot:Skav218278  [mRNA]  locus=scaffold2035:410376:411008:+ [translate_table: standard]
MCDRIHELLEVFGIGDAATDVLQRTGVVRLPGIGFVSRILAILPQTVKQCDHREIAEGHHPWLAPRIQAAHNRCESFLMSGLCTDTIRR